ncbi:MAG: phosphoribosylanthranilate isomerase [candidate division Zixibacteria bacterium]|nr:phosphoribosylanthranilate isomerase [candidate division Zixibacteria bacterium]
MSYFQIKVCGITRVSDARLAAELGADMLGLNFYSGSPRFVSVVRASRIIESVPPTVDTVGIFVDMPVKQVVKIAQQLRLQWVQLHGNEPDSDILTLQRGGVRVIKAFSVTGVKDWTRVSGSKADLRLVDNRSSSARGGTGKRFDWGILPKRRIERLALAGGVSAQNVALGVELFRPLLVDVNSSVETSPGLKSKVKLVKFFKVANSARY